MISGPAVALAAFLYLGLLFAVAHVVERQPERGRRVIDSGTVYTLSLAVYCTSWTFYGSVGRASRSGMDFLTIYVGPTLAFALGWALLRRILRVSKANRITSIADFIGSRYGKSAGLAGLVTVIAVIAATPYLALQLKAVSTGFALIEGLDPRAPTPLAQDAGLWTAVIMAAFAMLFGSRSIQPGEHHQGMVAALAVESVVKLLALIAVGVFTVWTLFDGPQDLFRHAAADPTLPALFAAGDGTSWVAYTFLSFAAVICLPRQFQVMVVENVNERHLNRAMWLFPLYLLAINLFVLPVAMAGRMVLPAAADPDSYVLTLPLAAHQGWLVLAVFIGGLSASAGMVIVAAAALSTMVSNDLVIPALLRLRPRRMARQRDLTRLLLGIRRAAMALVLGLGWLYMRHAGGDVPLVSIGLQSFAGVAQFFPAILAGLFWRSATRTGAALGISAGALVWIYTLLLPGFAHDSPALLHLVRDGPFGIAWLRPYALFGMEELDPVTHCVLWSALANAGALIGASLLGRPSVTERAQALIFVDIARHADAAQLWPRTARLPDLATLLGRFLGRRRASAALADWVQRSGRQTPPSQADAEMVLHAERLLAGAIGSASARVLVASVVQEEPLGPDEVMRILDETSRVIEYNQQLEEKSRALEAAGEELRRANAQLRELDRLKDDFVSTVSHELRTPLTAIRSLSEILVDNPDLDKPQRQEFQRIILRETERLTRLINQVLDLAKLESGAPGAVPGPVDLGAVLAEAASATAPLFRDRRVRLDLPPPASCPAVTGEHDLLVQMVLNLLSNAVKFCPEGTGHARVALETEGGTVLLRVADNGPGIAPEHRDLIFQRFRQGGDTLTAKPPGTGLGLAICRSIVQRFGGEISAGGTPGQGAVFVVRLRAA